MTGKNRSAWSFPGWALVISLSIATPVIGQDANSNPAGNPSAQAPQTGDASGLQAPTSDLAAAAKLAREQRAAEQSQRTDRSQAVNEMAGDLAREQDEPIAGAPTGYRYYYFQEGDYAILVPIDAKPEARDSYGLRLLSEEALTSRIEVILGEPIPALGNTPEEKIHNANNIYFGGCAYSISGLGPPVDGHPASGAAHGNCPLNEEVLGNVELVLGDGYVMPVVCGYPLTEEDNHPAQYQPLKKVLTKYDRERNGFNVCKLILPSLHFHPYGNRWNPKSTVPPPTKAAATTTNALTSSGNTVVSVSAEGGQSLGALARANRRVPAHEEMTELKHTAAGYESFPYRYFCTEGRAECYSMSLEIPVTAKRNEKFLMPYVGLFQFEVPAGDGVAVIEATTGAPSESGFVSREDIINTKVDWAIIYIPAEHYSGVGRATVMSEELTEYSGIPTRLATFRNPTAFEPVITYMATYMLPGKFVHLRCTVPEKVSGDLQGMCETVLRSIEVQMPRPIPFPQGDPPDADDPPASQEPDSQVPPQKNDY
jgi:hypothetical protein